MNTLAIWLQQLRTAGAMLAALTLLTGVIYPLAVTAVAQLSFSRQAEGSLLVVDGKPVGSELIGQSFTRPEYFWGRLSATAPVPYHAAASAGSNWGPRNQALQAAVAARLRALRAGSDSPDPASPNTVSPDTASPELVPVDLVTASGSGLDPHISPAAAAWQVPRVAAARQLGQEAVRSAVARHTQGRQFGLLGEPRVNVLQLNLELDQLRPGP